MNSLIRASENGWFTIEEYFLYFIYDFPYMGSFLVPIATLFSTVFVLGRLNSQNELIAYYTSGKSVYTLIQPVVVLAFIISSCYVVFDGPFVYENHLKRMHLHNKLHGREWNVKRERKNISIFGTDNKLFLIKRFTPGEAIMNKLQLFFMDTEGEQSIKKLMSIDTMRYDLNSDRWIASNVVTRDWTSGEMEIIKEDELKLELDEKPYHFEKVNKNMENMSTMEVLREARKLEITGGDSEDYYTEFYFKIALPFLSLIIVFIGVPLSTFSKRSSIVVSLLFVLFVVVAFFVTSYSGRSLGKIGILSPFIAGWFGNFTFGALAFYLSKRLQL